MGDHVEDLERDEEEIELTFADGQTLKAKRWMVRAAMDEVARKNLVRTIRAEIGLVKYSERINEEQEKAQ